MSARSRPRRCHRARYEAKVTIDEAWDENYGAGGTPDGDNIPFAVATLGDVVTFSYDVALHTLDIAVIPTEPVDDAALVRDPVRHPVRRRGPVLHACPTGSTTATRRTTAAPGTDRASPVTRRRTCSRTGTCPTTRATTTVATSKACGASCRISTTSASAPIWVGPIYANQAVQPDSSNLYGHSSGYHGYWILDFLNVDPHFGTNAEFAQLVDEAHGRGIKVFMDVVTNHTADVIELLDNAGYRNKRDFPYRDVNGVEFDDSDYAYAGQSDYTFPDGGRDVVPVHAGRAARS